MSPFGSSDKCIATMIGALGAATIGALAAGATSASNSSSQKSANATNLQISRETSERNYQIAKETNEMSQAQFNTNLNWLKEQFYKQREYALDERAYQDPSNIVDRLLKAGVNPAFGLGQGQMATPAVSAVGAPSQSSFQAGYSQAGHVDPVTVDYTGIGQSLGHAFDAFMSNELINAQTKKTNNEAQIAGVQAAMELSRQMSSLRKEYAEVENLLSSARLSDSQRQNLQKQRDLLDREIEFATLSLNDRIEQLQTGNELARAQKKRLDRETQHIDFEEWLASHRLQIESRLADSNIRLNSSHVSQMMAQISLIGAQVQSEVARGRNINEDTVTKQIINVIKDLEKEESKTYHGITNDNPSTKTVYYFAKYVKDLIIGNIFKFK